MNNIGNLTLIEGNNSKNGHKCNSSLGSKDYIKKKESYSGSSSSITRTIAKKYGTFTMVRHTGIRDAAVAPVAAVFVNLRAEAGRDAALDVNVVVHEDSDVDSPLDGIN